MATSVQPDRAEPLWFIDNLVHVLVDAETSNGRLALLDERGRRGNMPPLHVHHRDDETFYVIDGEFSLRRRPAADPSPPARRRSRRARSRIPTAWSPRRPAGS
jgi:hypothetical protein